MSQLLYWLPIGEFSIEFPLSVLLFMLPLNKRSDKKLQLWFCIISLAGIYIVLKATRQLQPILYSSLFLTILLGVWLFWSGVECNVWDAVFGATCAYALQHLAYVVSSILCTMISIDGYLNNICHMVIFCGIAVLCYKTVALRISKDGRYQTSSKDTAISLVLLLVFAFLLNILAEDNYHPQDLSSKRMFLICRLFAIICCGFVLWIQTFIYEKIHMENELELQRRIWQMQRDQYELSKVNIDLINQKCHDLKHQVHALKHISDDEYRQHALNDIESSVMIYDSMVKTGNAVLDIILTERSLQCQELGIEWTCMADASGLDFIDTIDLYAIMGNVLDNAIECVRNMQDREKRVISLNVQSKNGMVIIRASNYYEQEIEIKEGLPQTNKQDKAYHGFGTKSIRQTVEKYGGSVSYNAKEHVFTVCMVIPCAS